MFRFPFLSSRNNKPTTSGSQSAFPEKDPHEVEVDQFRAVLQSFGASRIKDRLAVLDVFLAIEQHVTITELEQHLRQKGPAEFDRFFVQETMDMFCRFGFAQEIVFESHEKRYEHHHLGTHHDHFICTRCGRIQEFVNSHLEQLQSSIAHELNFHPLQHKMEIYGLCAQCMGQRKDSISLNMAMKGERVRIVLITGGRGMQARLMAMGLRIDICLEVVSAHESGPLIVAVDGVRMALDSVIGQHILVAHVCRHEDHG